MGVADEVGTFDEHVAREEQIVGGTAGAVDGAVVTDAQFDGRAGWDGDCLAQAFRDGAFVGQL